MSAHPSDVLDGLVAIGREPGGAVAVVRGWAVEIELSRYSGRGLAVDLRHPGMTLLYDVAVGFPP